MKKLVTLLICLLVCVIDANLCAQNPADCVGAQAVCNNPNFTFSATPNNGNVNELPGTNSVSNPAVNPASGNFGCLLVGENNPQWLLLNISTSGQLEFSFGAAGSPNPQVGLYDWAMWPYNANTCNDIIGNTLPPVRCNWNSVGVGGTGIGTPPPGGNAGNYEPPLTVTAGQQYIICISNFSGVNTLVTFTSTGTAQIGCSNVFANSATVCPNQAAIITPTVVNIANPSYTLQPGNIVSTGPLLTVTASATQVFTISASTAPGTASNQATNTFTLHVIHSQTMALAGPLFYCSGTSASVSAPAGHLSYTLHQPNGTSQSGAGNSFTLGAANPALSGTYTITATAQNGCVNTGTTQVTAYPIPVLTIAGPTLVCQHGTLQLSCSNPNLLTGQWAGPNGSGSVTSTLSIPGFQPNQGGTYTLTAAVNLGPLACPATQTVQVAAIPVYPVLANPSQTVCVGSVIQLTAIAPNTTLYQWSGPSAFVSSLQNPVIANATLARSGIYSVSAVFSQNGTNCYTSASTKITVESGLQFSLPERASFCGGSDVLVTGPAAAASYQWKGPLNFSSSQKDLLIPQAAAHHSGTYTLSLTSAFQCSFSKTVTVSVLPPLLLVKAPQNKTICQQSRAHNLIEISGGSGIYTYQYQPMDGITHYGGNEIYASPNTSLTYTVHVKDPACPTTQLTSKFTIDVIPLPQAAVVSNVQEGCEPLRVELSMQPASSTYTSSWQIENKQYTNTDSLVHVFRKAGTYQVALRVTDTRGCSAVHQAAHPIRVFPQPRAYFTYSPSHITTLNNRVSFQAHSRAGGIKDVRWLISNPADSSSLIQPVKEFQRAGWHPVVMILENEFGCSDTTLGTVQVHEELLVYLPNAFSPNRDGLNEEFKPMGEGLSSDDYELLIFNRWGTCIFVSHRPEQGWNGELGGKPAMSDTYTYRLRFRATESIAQKEISGHVTLLR